MLHTDITHIMHIHVRLHIHKLIQVEAPFYSNFSGQFNFVKAPGSDGAAITQNIHQMALFRHFLYFQVLPEVSPEMVACLGRGTQLAELVNPRSFPLPPSHTHPRGGFPKSAISTLSKIGSILSSFQASVEGADSRTQGSSSV